MLDPEIVRKLVESGYSYVCASCYRLHDGLVRNLGRCTAPGECAGPISGMDYPLYVGPLSSSEIASRCFRCGAPSVSVVLRGVRGGVGVCGQHVAMLRSMVAVDALVRRAG